MLIPAMVARCANIAWLGFFFHAITFRPTLKKGQELR